MAKRAEAVYGGRHGLLFGKYLPFHAGHRELIRHALARCDTVTVVVFSRDAESIPGDVRKGWIEAECPGARVVHVVANMPDPWDDVSWAFWAGACRRCAPSATHLFTGEAYGDELARRMGIAHERVDRSAAGASGTAIRQDPVANWCHVPDAVRPWLVRKVAIVGAESTGKSTLAEDLARLYGTVWVPEYGREYCELKDIFTLTPTDLLAIASEQAALEDRLAVRSNGLLICDTDLMVTRTWSRHLCGTVHPGIREVERGRRYDLHLVTSPGVAWQNDGTRVCECDATRTWFHRAYVDELTRRRAPHIELPPRRGDALALAANLIDTLWPSLRPMRACR
jgi:HTH-type transcriptional regulator, transcriptional repressor of NAD biosynthesis genes